MTPGEKPDTTKADDAQRRGLGNGGRERVQICRVVIANAGLAGGVCHRVGSNEQERARLA